MSLLNSTRAGAYTLDELQKAAEAGNPIAERELGKAYYFGHRLPQNYDNAFAWLLKAAIKQDAIAETIVAQMYENGLSVKKDETKAFDWYYRAADQGENFSQRRIGNLYIEGRVIKQDLAKGFTYLLHAAAKGYPPAEFDVALCYAKGTYVKPDPILAYKWALLSSINLKSAEAALPNFTKNLSPAQINQGQLAAEDDVRRAKFGLPQHDLKVAFENRFQTKFLFASSGGNICVSAMVQGARPAYFIVDTGSARTILDTDVADKLGLKSNDYEAFGAFGKSLALGYFVNDVQLALPGLLLSHARVTVSPLSTATLAFSNLHPFGDVPLGGIIGSDILSHFVMHIDYANSQIEFISNETFHPPIATDVLPLEFYAQLPSVEASIKNGTVQTKPTRFLVDSGSGCAVSFSHTFTHQNSDLALHVSLYSGVFGLGGPNPAPVGKCSGVILGKTSILRPVFVLAQPLDDPALEGTLGNDILRRFDVTIDYAGKKLYLTPNAALTQPFNCNLYGLVIKQMGKVPPTYVVSKVWEDSAASKLGIKEGDVIEKINKTAPDVLTNSKVQSLLCREGAINLDISRDGTIHLYKVHSAVLPSPD